MRGLGVLCLSFTAFAQGPENVLLVVNQSSEISRHIGEYYMRQRGIPAGNVCRLHVTAEETVDWATYQKDIEQPMAAFLKQRKLQDKILYIATTLGVPLRVTGAGSGQGAENASVDSELTLLYAKMRGAKFSRAGPVPNPFFQRRDMAFRHPGVPIYLVTRLAAFDFADVKAMIDRGLQARNRGKFVIDLSANDDNPGNKWLRAAALLLPASRLVLDESANVLYHEKDVIGYAGWGSNDHNRRQRHLGFQWLPGAIATEFVSSDGRTFKRPPDNWNISTWKEKDKPLWFAGTPQSLSTDYIHDGATGCSGHIDEPYLVACPRPDYLLPAYFSGRTLAESYYIAIPTLSWQNIVLGDPLCSLGKP